GKYYASATGEVISRFRETQVPNLRHSRTGENTKDLIHEDTKQVQRTQRRENRTTKGGCATRGGATSPIQDGTMDRAPTRRLEAGATKGTRLKSPCENSLLPPQTERAVWPSTISWPSTVQ